MRWLTVHSSTHAGVISVVVAVTSLSSCVWATKNDVGTVLLAIAIQNDNTSSAYLFPIATWNQRSL